MFLSLNDNDLFTSIRKLRLLAKKDQQLRRDVKETAQKEQRKKKSKSKQDNNNKTQQKCKRGVIWWSLFQTEVYTASNPIFSQVSAN